MPELTRLPDKSRWHHFAGGKGLIVIGRLMSETDINVIVQLSECLGWPLIADVQSRLHGHPKAIRHADLYWLVLQAEAYLIKLIGFFKLVAI